MVAFKKVDQRLVKVTGGIFVLLGVAKIAFVLCDSNPAIATVSA